MISIAIDGPSGAGKSTLAQALAKRLGYLYVDTGALYRAVALAVLRSEVNTQSEKEVAAILPELSLSVRFINDEQRVFIREDDVTEPIRDEKVGLAASQVSAYPSVREYLLDFQKNLAKENNVIMDGRDIGTVVLPDADIKIFLSATPEERARRRYQEIIARGEKADFDQVMKDVEQRDYNDSHRAISPLRKADGAVDVITSGFTFEQSLELLLSVIQERLSEK